MPIDVKEVPSRRTLTREDNQWVATRSFSVTGSSSELEAMNAPGIPEYNEAHPQNAGLLVKSLGVESPQPTIRYVTVSYKRGGGGDSPDPLDDRPHFTWQRGSRVEEFNRDIFGNPIVNTNGDGFEGNPSIDIGTLLLRIERNEPYFDIPRSLTYTNAVNSDTFTLFGYGSVEPGQCLCTSIIPVSGHPFDEPYVRMSYDFEFRRGDAQDADGLWDGFKIFVLNQGYRAYATADGVLKFCKIADDTGSPISSPAKLNALGVPFESRYLALLDNSERKVFTQTPLVLPSGVYKKEVADAVYLKFQQYKKAAFQGLL